MANTAMKAIVVGISGCSSSGKTTLCRLLRDIFPNTFVLHEDDFYRPETELPTTNGLLDWDCAESLNISDTAASLKYIREHGSFPPHFDSKEDKNSVGEIPVPDSTIVSLKARVSEWAQPGKPGHKILVSGPKALKMCIFDGFLLYCPKMAPIQPYMDIKMFLRVSYAKAKARREARSGYVTLEGFWEDPPGYVDKIVWPNYVQDHKWMFEDGDVEGKLKHDVLEEWKIKTQLDRGLDVDMETTLKWAVETIMKELESLAKGAN